MMVCSRAHGDDGLRFDGLVAGAAFRIQKTKQPFKGGSIGRVPEKGSISADRYQVLVFQLLEMMRKSGSMQAKHPRSKFTVWRTSPPSRTFPETFLARAAVAHACQYQAQPWSVPRLRGRGERGNIVMHT
jgi:hypothetical protein